ncbi:hypothetical protein GCM10010123_03160 [Pilimelia anulata]|uniref:VCBS repeat-containing protein n=1 Tax=Pilimelia anulata TaxID=53371 RepID=A0A8J3B3L4_9ACTN|nr:VCBS repeat-containing protein [Pilimelia anulata]GGJ76546.1 hypothetical protein GCM10010123_03160 [Pilimelia anulata]
MSGTDRVIRAGVAALLALAGGVAAGPPAHARPGSAEAAAVRVPGPRRGAAEVPPASVEEKITAAKSVGLEPGLIVGLGDRDATFKLWQAVGRESEAAAAAVLALNDDVDADAGQTVACSLYIRAGLAEALARDINQELRDKAAAAEAVRRRTRAAELVHLPDAAAQVGLGDREFIIALWNHVKTTLPQYTETIAAAERAFATPSAARERFLELGFAEAYAADQRRLIDKANADDAAAAKEAKRRLLRQLAAAAVGVAAPVTDPAWMDIRDDDFLRRLDGLLYGNAHYTLTAVAVFEAIRAGVEASRAFIDGGVHEVVAKDVARRRAEIIDGYRAAVTDVRRQAERDGLKNIAVAARRTLATAGLEPLIVFLQRYRALGEDPPDVFAFRTPHKDPSAKGVELYAFGHLGRTTATARKVWSSTSWVFARFDAASGDFDADGKRDVAVLYEVSDTHHRIFVFPDVEGPRTAPVLWWEHQGKGASYTFVDNLVAGDVNGDGATDLAVTADDDKYKPQLVAFLSDRKGAFAQRQRAAGAGYAPYYLALGDVTGDRNADLIGYVSTREGTKIWVTPGGAAGWGTPVLRFTSKTGEANSMLGNRLVPYDIDRDGRPELTALRELDSHRVALLVFDNLAPGGPAVREQQHWVASGVLESSVGAAIRTEVNGDGQPDITILGVGDKQKLAIRVLRGSRSGGINTVRRVISPAGTDWETYFMKAAE